MAGQLSEYLGLRGDDNSLWHFCHKLFLRPSHPPTAEKTPSSIAETRVRRCRDVALTLPVAGDPTPYRDSNDRVLGWEASTLRTELRQPATPKTLVYFRDTHAG